MTLTPGQPTPQEIIREVSEEFGVPCSVLSSKGRLSDRAVDAKHEAMARVHEAHREMSFYQIARHFGGTDHSTIINALKRLKAGRYANGQPRQRMEIRPVLTRDVARARYFEEKHSLHRISKDFNCRESLVRSFFEKHELRNPAYAARMAARTVPVPETPARAPAHAVAGTLHLIDFKRSGYTAAYYQANCEIGPLEDMRERRALARHRRVTPARGHEGSWMGSPAALCAV